MHAKEFSQSGSVAVISAALAELCGDRSPAYMRKAFSRAPISNISTVSSSAVDVFPARLEMARELGADTEVAAAGVGDWFTVPEHRVDAALVCATSADRDARVPHAPRGCATAP